MSVSREQHSSQQMVTTKLDYLLHIPDNYSPANPIPLMLFLHGAGERGDDLDLVKKHGPIKVVEAGQKLPFMIAAPQCPLDEIWFDYSHALITLIDQLIGSFAIDPKRVYLTGLSMGGYGSWDLARKYPERFAAVAPICGGMKWLVNLDHAAQCLKEIPIWTFHGTKDEAVPVERTKMMVEALKLAGGNIRFTEYPELKHDAWTVTYENPKLYDWFLKYSLD